MKHTIGALFVILLFLGCAQSAKKVNKSITNDSAVINNSATIVSDTAPSPDRFRKQFEQGIDFMASGNEPFWSLQIDFEKAMHFKTVSGFEIVTPAVEGVKAMDANVIRYHAKTEKGTLTVQIQKLECINEMSGEKLDYTVTVDTKNNTDKDYAIYKGCGRYLADYRLHDIWALDSINNQKMKTADFTKGLPLLEFNLTEKKVHGNTGCNNINGPMEVMGNKIQFGRLATTRMACKNMNFESKYLQKLDNKTVPYQIKPGKLYLQVSPDSVFIYKKID